MIAQFLYIGLHCRFGRIIDFLLLGLVALRNNLYFNSEFILANIVIVSSNVIVNSRAFLSWAPGLKYIYLSLPYLTVDIIISLLLFVHFGFVHFRYFSLFSNIVYIKHRKYLLAWWRGTSVSQWNVCLEYKYANYIFLLTCQPNVFKRKLELRVIERRYKLHTCLHTAW